MEVTKFMDGKTDGIYCTPRSLGELIERTMAIVVSVCAEHVMLKFGPYEARELVERVWRAAGLSVAAKNRILEELNAETKR